MFHCLFTFHRQHMGAAGMLELACSIKQLQLLHCCVRLDLLCQSTCHWSLLCSDLDKNVADVEKLCMIGIANAAQTIAFGANFGYNTRMKYVTRVWAGSGFSVSGVSKASLRFLRSCQGFLSYQVYNTFTRNPTFLGGRNCLPDCSSQGLGSDTSAPH